MNRKYVVIWSAVIGAEVIYDVWATVNETPGDSLSEVLRTTLRTDTPAGRALFLGGWATLTAWFIPHILNGGDQ